MPHGVLVLVLVQYSDTDDHCTREVTSIIMPVHAPHPLPLTAFSQVEEWHSLLSYLPGGIKAADTNARCMLSKKNINLPSVMRK